MAPFVSDPKFWVMAAFVLFVALVYKKLTRAMAASLDTRSARIAAELDEARKLREEAQAVLADYQRRQAESLREAEDILSKARRDAAQLTAQAEQELKEALEARTRIAEEKIAQEEQKAIQDVRAQVADIAIGAARVLIAEHLTKMVQDDLVKRAIGEMERKIH